MIGEAPSQRRSAIIFECIIVLFAITMLLVGQLMLSAAMLTANSAGGDNKMAQAVTLAAFRFAGFFELNSISPIQGVGSQLLPINVWLNPTYWPFAFADLDFAANMSAAIALALFVVAGYIMARCFDVPPVPSAIGAQLCIGLFAPLVLILKLSTVFILLKGTAVVYAPYMIALGLLARLEPGSRRAFGLTTAGLFALLIYSIVCDPLWSAVGGISWAVPFAVVTFGALRPKTIMIRCAALGCCFLLLFLSGAAEYVYTMARYSARVEFAAAVDRVRAPDLSATALFYSPYMKYFYLLCIVGWVLGLLTLRGRARLLVIAAVTSWVALLVCSVLYLLMLNVAWQMPLPVYLEQCLFFLFIISAVAGLWGALDAAVSRAFPFAQLSLRLRSAVAAAALVAVAIIPTTVADYAVRRAPLMAAVWREPWPEDPELTSFLTDRISVRLCQPFRGVMQVGTGLKGPDELMLYKLWRDGVPTVMEYDQLVTPQSAYFGYALLQSPVGLNTFLPIPGRSWKTFWDAIRLFGSKYFVAGHARVPQAEESALPLRIFPYQPSVGEQGLWYVYELANPNLGNYSPTIVLEARSGTDIVAKMAEPNFDFTKQAVLSVPIDHPLVPAREMQLIRVRGGLRVSGKSDGTSLVVLPQQFSHCLRALDSRVRLVRADLMMTGMIFSGAVDTEIVLDYGIFTPRCRWKDIADVKHLDLKIDVRQVHLKGDRLLPDWNGVMERFRRAVSLVQ